MKFYEKLKKLRQENNLTQQELADKIFVSRSAVAKWEQNRGLPSKELLESLSKIFNISEEELLGNNEAREMAINNTKSLLVHKRIVKILVAFLVPLLITAIVLMAISIKINRVYVFNHTEIGYYKVFGGNNPTGRAGVNGYKIDLNDVSIPCEDWEGNKIDIGSLKLGYELCLEIATYSSIRNGDKYKIKKIIVLNDYLEGDEYYCGFVLLDKDIGVNPLIEDLGASFSEFLYETSINGGKYFYFSKTGSGTSQANTGNPNQVKIKEVGRQFWNNRWKREDLTFTGITSSEDDKYFVYLMNGSQDKLKLVGLLNKYNPTYLFKGAVFDYKFDKRDLYINITIDFENDTVI